MALTWNVEEIKNYKTTCWIDEGTDQQRMNPVTEALIFNSMAIGIGRITADNVGEVWARTKILERINGPLLTTGRGEDRYLTEQEMYAHVGLSTNVSFESRKDWAMRWFVGHGDYLRHYGEKRKSQREIDFAEDNHDGIDVSRTEELRRQFVRAIEKVTA